MAAAHNQNSEYLVRSAFSACSNNKALLKAFGSTRALHKTLGYCKALDRDYGEVTPDNGLFTADHHTAQALPRAFYKTAILRWQGGERPSLVALAAAQLDHLDLTITDKAAMASQPEEIQALARAVILMATRAEMIKGRPPGPETEKNANPYHNTVHTAHVASMALYHSGLHNKTANGGDQALGVKDRLIHLVAAYAHDLDHPGHANPQGQIYYNEDNSFAVAKPLLEAASVSPETVNTIHAMIRTTSPNGPSQALKSAVTAHEAGKPAEIPTGFPELAPLLQDAHLCTMASLLTDADLFASAGAGMASNVMMTLRFREEEERARGLVAAPLQASRATLTRGFLEYGIGDGFSSKAVRTAFNNSVSDLRKLYLGDGKPYPPDPAKPYTGPHTPPAAP